MRWKVDTEIISPEEMAAIQTLNPEAVARPAQPDRTPRNPTDTTSESYRYDFGRNETRFRDRADSTGNQ